MKYLLIITLALTLIACDKKVEDKKLENAYTKSVAKKVAVLEKAKKNAKALEKNIDATKKKVDKLNKDVKEVAKDLNKDATKIVDNLSAKVLDQEFYKVTYDFSEAVSEKDMKVTIKVIPKKDHHINDGFPVSVKFNDGCFKFAKEKFKKADVKKIDAQELIFELNGKCATKGETILGGTLKFGHCTDEICSTAQENFKFNINVK